MGFKSILTTQATYFSPKPECIHGIHMLPITPITPFIRKSWQRRRLPHTQQLQVMHDSCNTSGTQSFETLLQDPQTWNRVGVASYTLISDSWKGQVSKPYHGSSLHANPTDGRAWQYFLENKNATDGGVCRSWYLAMIASVVS